MRGKPQRTRLAQPGGTVGRQAQAQLLLRPGARQGGDQSAFFQDHDGAQRRRPIGTQCGGQILQRGAGIGVQQGQDTELRRGQLRRRQGPIIEGGDAARRLPDGEAVAVIDIGRWVHGLCYADLSSAGSRLDGKF